MKVICALLFATCVSVAATKFDAFDLENALSFSRAAYCNSSSIQSWNCGEVCTGRPNFVVEKIITASASSPRITAFIGYDPSDRAIVISFRGTSTPGRWINSLRVAKLKEHPDPACNCQVHAATYDEWTSISSVVLTTMDNLSTKYSQPRIIFTGHGLGGWFATLAAMDCAAHYTKNFVVYTFGEPRLGDDRFATFASKLLVDKRFRVTSGGDVISLLPPKARGYRHFGKEIWFPNHFENSPKLCRNFDGPGADKSCSESADRHVLPGDDDVNGLRDHLIYVGKCMDCNCASKVFSKKHGREIANAVVAILPKLVETEVDL